MRINTFFELILRSAFSGLSKHVSNFKKIFAEGLNPEEFRIFYLSKHSLSYILSLSQGSFVFVLKFIAFLQKFRAFRQKILQLLL